MSTKYVLGAIALLFVAEPCASVGLESSLLAEDFRDALMEDAAFDEGIQLVQSKAKKIIRNEPKADKPVAVEVKAEAKPVEVEGKKAEPKGEEVPFIDQNTYKPSVEDWKKVQAGLFLLRGHAEGSTVSTSTAELQSMLDTLKGLYAEQSTAGLDAKEHESEAWIEAQKVKHEKRLEEIAVRDEAHVLEHSFYEMEARSENLTFKYWEGVRERQHKKYVSLVEMKQGMMDRVKHMIDVYETVLATRSADASAEHAPVSKELPSHAQPAAIINFCDSALAHVSDALKRSEDL